MFRVSLYRAVTSLFKTESRYSFYLKIFFPVYIFPILTSELQGWNLTTSYQLVLSIASESNSSITSLLT